MNLQNIKRRIDNRSVTTQELRWLIKQAEKLEWLKQAIEVCNDEKLTPKELANKLKC
jgi:hypothetical protein